MALDQNHPRDMVEHFLASAAETVAVAGVELLQILGRSLRDVIGEEGFDSLLLRSLRRAGARYPWLQLDDKERPGEPEFVQWLQACRGRDPVEVQAAYMLLFTTFVDTLSVLIGAHLTTLILTSALACARVGLQEQGTAQ